MTDLLTVLKHCQHDFKLAKRLLGEKHHGFMPTRIEVEEAIAYLTVPFSGADLLGWVKEREDYWCVYGEEGYFALRKSPFSDTTFEITWQKNMSLGSSTLYRGPIKTAHFFALLCGALEITTTPRVVAKPQPPTT